MNPRRIAVVKASERERDAGAGTLVEEYVDEEQALQPGLDDVHALELVIKKYDLAARWSTMRIEELSPRLVRAEVGRRCLVFCRDARLDPVKDARRAQDAVFDADPELKAAYARS